MKLKEWVESSRGIFTESDLAFLIKSLFSENFLYVADEYLDSERLYRLEDIKKLYIEGMPLAYILGKEEFFGLEFNVDPSVLIPRKETEVIAEKSIELIKGCHFSSILDLGCGSGAIAISIKKIVGNHLNVIATDISLDALRIASTNSTMHNLNLRLINTDLFSGLKKCSFDLIISNPPYVETWYVKHFLPYEPEIALCAGEHGFTFIKKILKTAHYYLRKGGYLILEIGYNHKCLVENLLQELTIYETVEWIKDYDGHYRGVVLSVK